MKKIIILTIMVLFSFSLIAQTVVSKRNIAVKKTSKEEFTTAVKYYSSKSTLDFGTPMYPQTFAEGMPTGWTATVAIGDPSWKWKWTMTGPNGPTMSSVETINSTTASNGWMIFDSDSIGNGTYDVSLVTESYDFSDNQTVQIVLEEWYRKWGDSTFIGVSSNGGTTWTDIRVHADFEQKDATTNPSILAVNITALAAMKSDVKIRFRMIGDWDYVWQIDDIKFFEVPENDIQIQKIYADYDTYGGVYNLIPRSQPASGIFGAKILNYGSNTQTNVVLNVKVNNGLTDIYNQSTTPIATQLTLAKDSVTIASTSAFELNGSAAASNYTINYNISSDVTDQDASNNTHTLHLQTTNGIYGRDNGVANSRISPMTWVDGGNDGDIIAVGYEITAEAVAQGIHVFIHSTTQVGSNFKAFVSLSNGSGGYVEQAWSDLIEVTTDMIGKWNYIPFLTPTTLPIEYYIVGLEIYYASYDFYIGEDNTTTQSYSSTTWRFSDGEYTGITNYLNRTPMIRLQIEDALSDINTVNNNNEISIYPNPSNGILNIKNANKSIVSVYNMIGEKVAEMNCISTISSFNLSYLLEGTYIVKVQNSNNITNSKINIIK